MSTDATPATEATADTEATTDATRTVRGADRKVREGLVVSDKMDKTVVVAMEHRVKHPL